MTFDSLALAEPLLHALQQEGYTTPTPIQAQAIPIVLQGKDLLGCAQTGTGKTAAFALPILHKLLESEKQKGIRALIVTPTRELAIQIGDSFKAYGRNTPIQTTVVFGGVKAHKQIASLKGRTDILVATPGRVFDLYHQGYVKLGQLQLFVLDEADRMLDMGFIHDVKRLIQLLPAKRQTLFFSATMPPAIVKLANTLLTTPARVEVTPVSSTAETIQQKLYFCTQAEKQALLMHVLEDKEINPVLIFTRTKHGADRVVKFLVKQTVKAEAIHGNKSQNARQKALENFRNGSIRVLVATDIASRGIDIDELKYVINFEVPNISETYVHRIGRGGRAGNEGVAITFCSPEEKVDWQAIERLTKQKIPATPWKK